MNLYLHIHETHSRVIFFTWCILTCYYRKTAALQINGHQLIERTQKKKITHPVNTITHCLYTFVPLQHWSNDASHWLASFHCPLIPNCTHFLFVSQINQRSPSAEKKNKKRKTSDQPGGKRVSEQRLIATWKELKILSACTYRTKPLRALMDARRVNEMFNKSGFLRNLKRASLVWASVTECPAVKSVQLFCTDVMAYSQLTAAKGDGKPSLAR